MANNRMSWADEVEREEADRERAIRRARREELRRADDKAEMAQQLAELKAELERAKAASEVFEMEAYINEEEAKKANERAEKAETNRAMAEVRMWAAQKREQRAKQQLEPLRARANGLEASLRALTGPVAMFYMGQPTVEEDRATLTEKEGPPSFKGWQLAVINMMKSLPSDGQDRYTRTVKGAGYHYTAALRLYKRFTGSRSVAWREEIMGLIYRAEDCPPGYETYRVYLESPKGPAVQVALYKPGALV